MAETTVTLESTLSALIEGKKYAALRDILITMNPADVAAVFEETDELALPLLFRLLPKELAAETFVEMQPEQQELLIRGFSDTELKEVVDELYVDDAVDLVEEMPAPPRCSMPCWRICLPLLRPKAKPRSWCCAMG